MTMEDKIIESDYNGRVRTMRLSDEALEQLLAESESDRVERKESFKGDVPQKLRQAICAFANDLPNHASPAVAFVGVSDDGFPTGLPITDELLRALSDIKTDGKITPPPSLLVEKRTLRGHEIAVVTVMPSDAPPVRLEGRIWIRVGPRRALASKQDEAILNERRRFRDRPFDIQPLPSAKMANLDRYYYEAKYLPATVAQDVLEANDRSYEQRLAASKMVASVDDPTPTFLGMLVVGSDPRFFIPHAYIQFLRLDGTDLASPVIDEAAIDGKLADVVVAIDGKLRAHNTTRVDITSGPVEKRQPRYPIAALEQLVRNALTHRTYENTYAPVRVLWLNHQVEIWSPGGPFGAVTKANFGEPGLAEYRNPNIAEAMKGLGFVQRFGLGLQIAKSELQKNGNPPPEFEVSDQWVRATLKPAF